MCSPGRAGRNPIGGRPSSRDFLARNSAAFLLWVRLGRRCRCREGRQMGRRMRLRRRSRRRSSSDEPSGDLRRSSFCPGGALPESLRSRGNGSTERVGRPLPSLGQALFETKFGSRAVSRLRMSAPCLKPRVALRSRPNPVLPWLPL